MQSKDILAVINKNRLSWQRFHDASKLDEGAKTSYAVKLDFEAKHYKGYPRLPSLPLPMPDEPKMGLGQALGKRCSFRDFTGKKVPLTKMSTLLYYGMGMKGKKGQRFYPSAGGLYPVEAYILSLHTPLSPGLYHYYVRSHLLEELITLPTFDTGSYFAQSWIQNAAFVIILTASIKRGMQKYGERAYRYMMIEAGHIGQTVSLIAPALRLSACAIGGFYDDRLNRLIDLEEGDEEAIYCMAVGRT